LNPVSLACDYQRALDGLAFAGDYLRAVAPISPQDPLSFALPFDGDGLVRYREAPAGLFSGHLVEFLLVLPARGIAFL
jgi:hypothetical protein